MCSVSRHSDVLGRITGATIVSQDTAVKTRSAATTSLSYGVSTSVHCHYAVSH